MDATRTLATFLRDGRLVRLPARWERKKLVLRHIAETCFEPDRLYGEGEVDAVLGALCDGGGTDRVTVRRLLVDLHLLRRDHGRYWLGAQTADLVGPGSSSAPGGAESTGGARSSAR
ncbi:DUF2087 domain-containing protein [Actinomycetospora sp. NBRC 106378]|uniref:DUF2087 domain-containing protein n=1 Tax=Actinomycetospora sp. NBRC 106378 TaxID=3032208 RepID=UPI0024A4A3E7|nr:DUF2087 domain-containing protein [Actinomycetospora sp. NBRC 106378]GLZ53677.1 hypothetical protein Acsp07_32940 [Actinomycetospora sp. NBRC 106378]